MAFFDRWTLNYPIPEGELDSNSLSVRGRTAGQNSAGQFELRGSGDFPDGRVLVNRDIINRSVLFEVREPSTGFIISLTTRYPVTNTGGKVRIYIHGDGVKRPNVGNLFTSLLLLPAVGKVNDSLPLQENGFAERTYWMDTAEVKPVGTSDGAYVLELTRLFFATGNKHNGGQFSGAIEYDYKSRISEIISACERGSKIKAGGIPAALKYFSDVYAGKLDFDYDIANFMRKVISDYLVSADGIDYEQGDDLLPALNQLIDLAVEKRVRNSGSVERYFNLANLPAEFETDFARRYITSLLAKPFVILTGNSGTGKTRVSKRFAKHLEVMDEDGEPNWLLVPVGADWTDNTKVLGFYNPLADGGKGVYEETGILKLIRRANAHPDIPYFLILDEMNLSHVERYFSDFLSHMEAIGDDNLIMLDGYKGACSDDDAKLAYPQNLFVIGTVNIDETTYMFSPKVLDRANVIEFKPSKDDVLAWFKLSEGTQDVPTAAPGVSQSLLSLAKGIREGKGYIDTEDLTAISTTFDRLYDVLEDCGFEFAYRTVREVRRYINAAHEFDGDGFKLDRSIDEQIAQKILPKLHGNKREIGGLLEGLAQICHGELSRAKISQMQARLANVQYTSFI